MAGTEDGPPDPPDDLDAQWADLTARLGPLDPGLPAEFTEPGTDDSPGTQEATEPTPPRWAGSAPAPPGPRDHGGPGPEGDDGDFAAPDPGPVLGAPTRNTLPWVGAIGGPIVMLLMLVLWPSAPPAAYLTAMGVTMAGLLTLWWRLPVHRRDDDDDGAVV
ncbi:hypothetical protein [Pseudactinotalea sp. Z1748]|uniref:hypothetical protein n=1 Tax=Pseudactinotalea sp. Z1748 TaxID=3413027 RepID=UPI003C7A16F8